MSDQAAMAEPSEAPRHRSKWKRCGQSGDTTEENPRRHKTAVQDDAMAQIVEHVNKMVLGDDENYSSSASVASDELSPFCSFVETIFIALLECSFLCELSCLLFCPLLQ